MPKEQIPTILALLSDPAASDEQKFEALWTVEALRSNVDRRHVVPVIVGLLKSDNDKLRGAAIPILGYLDSKHAIEPLLRVAADRADTEANRTEAIRALSYADDQRVHAQFQRMMFEAGEAVEVRSMAVEWYPSSHDSTMDLWLRLLDDPLPDLRFWAAYRLLQTWSSPGAALPALDRVAAYDHTIPKYWGWHVDREALYPLEQIYSLPYRQRRYPDRDSENLPGYSLYLISPALEYFDFSHAYRQTREDGIRELMPENPVSLKINPDWLKAEILATWQGVTFDARQPKPQTYLLDWYIEIDGQDLLGGLHRDQNGVVLTGKREAVCAFAAWYRSIIAPEHRLYLYEWADPGAELTPGISADEIAKSSKATLDAWTVKPAKPNE